MSVEALLAKMRDLGVNLVVEEGDLRVSAPKGVLDDALRADLTSSKPAIIAALRSLEAGASTGLPPIEAQSACEDFPLTHAQERLWLIHRLVGDPSIYNIFCCLHLRGALNLDALRQAIDQIVARHASLRTRFVSVDGQPRQRVVDSLTDYFNHVDLSRLPSQERESSLREQVRTGVRTSFDLERGPLIKVTLFRLDEDEFALLIIMHHLVSDGLSMGVFSDELERHYRHYNESKDAELPDLPVQYTDYSIWERKWFSGSVIDGQLQYWRSQLSDLPVLELPSDYPRPATPTGRGAEITFEITSEVTERLEQLSRDHDCTLYITLLSAFTLLLQKYSGQDDIVVGTPIANRRRPELKSLIGFFVNMLVLRVGFDGNPAFAELIARVKAVMLEAHANQDVPFENLVAELRPERDFSRNPLFQVTFSLQNDPVKLPEFTGVSTGLSDDRLETTRFDFEAHLNRLPAGMSVQFVYNADLFAASTVARMADHFARLLEAVAARPDRPVSRISLLSETEQRQILVDWNDTISVYPRDSNLVDLFEARAAAQPDAVAVSHDGQVLSYAELNVRANRLAHYLIAAGTGPNELVSLFVDRSPALIVGMLGILKAGAAYLPLDLDYPQSRIAFMLGDARTQVLLTTSALRDRLPEYDGKLICLDSDWPLIEREDSVNPETAAGAEDLAYAIYTSGSTGQPKGVLVPRRAVVRLVCDTDYYQVQADDRIAQASNVSFDAATFEIWGAMLNGARIVIVNKEALLSPAMLADFLRGEGITAMFVTTALFNQLSRAVPDAFRGLRGLMFGGEAVDPGAVRTVLEAGPPASLIHVYGPTESTTFATWYRVDGVAEDATTIPIGFPLANTTAYVLDANRLPVPVGVRGELYLGGDGLARGYLNQPELSAEKFVPDPFAGDRDARLYRTGDIVSRGEDGAIRFVGRIDGQIKLRGHRIELGEIEAALNRQPEIETSVVLPDHERAETKMLVAYVVFAQDRQLSADVLRARLQEILPPFMLPGAFVYTNEIPLNANGKVDKAALPSLGREQQDRASYIAPRNDVEARIAHIWQSVLELENPGAHDNFFSLGGNSLLLARVHEKIQSEFGIEFSLLELFKYPTIATLAQHLLEGESRSEEPLVAGAISADSMKRGTGPIAIVGMTGRFPGADDVETFWQNLCDEVESIAFPDKDVLRRSGVPDSMLQQPGYVGAASCLANATEFDAGFFGYSPRQARLIDPQQRMFLECAWEVLERAGYDPGRYAGRIGVYGGASTNQYLSAALQDREQSFNTLDCMLGSDKDFVATRVAYQLDLKGPGITVQTACSTSLVATHLAVKALHDGDCEMAIAGGSAIRNFEAAGYLYEEGGILSPDGHCRAFDADASGTVSGDGTAVVLLKPLGDALADGDQVYAVIKGTAINNDGAQKIGYTAPAVAGQARVIAEAQARAGVDPDSISYVETHGTGTPLGDPIEIEALTDVFGRAKREDNPCAIASLKTNVGHLDSAAGAAGLIKTALSLWHRKIPPSLNFRAPNPRIDFANSPFFVNTELRGWEAAHLPRRAGVSSFGIGGTNAHAVLEEAPPREPSVENDSHQLLLLSARTPTALDSMTDNLRRHLLSDPHANLADVAYTLQVGRQPFKYRRSMVCRDVEDAVAGLEVLDPKRVGGAVTNDSEAPIVFMFSGQGSQYPGMGAGLYRDHTVYREVVDQCSELLQPRLQLDLRELLFPADQENRSVAGRLTATEIAQPALFVTEYALARLWQSWGIEPAALIGHSIGEYAAACLANVMSLEDALDLVATRGRLMAEMPSGSMLAVPAPEADILSWLIDGVEIAAVNNPNMCVVAGERQVIAEFAAQLEDRGLQGQPLHTSHAFHSAMMEPILEPFTECVARCELAPPRIPYISNVTGTWITDEEATRPDYYAAHLRGAVRFSAGLEQLLAEPECILLEVGPGDTLGSLTRMHPNRREAHVVLSSLRHAADESADDAVAWRAVAGLWLAGRSPDWAAIHGAARRRRVLLPTYPFERQKYWLGSKREPAPSDLARNEDPANWIYLPSWRRAPLQAPAAPAAQEMESTWLVFDDARGLGGQLVADLEASGAGVIRVLSGERYARLDDACFEIDPASPADYRSLVQAVEERGRLPKEIVHLWSAAGSDGSSPHEPLQDSALERGFYSLVYLLQALEATAASDAVNIALVTSSSCQVSGGDRLNPARSMALGVCRVAAMEIPRVACRVIDVDEIGEGDESGRLCQLLARDLMTPTDHPVVAYRRNYRWSQAFDRVHVDSPGRDGEATGIPPSLRRSGVYLIAGGLGALGLELAAYLAKNVEARLVLVSRSGLPERSKWSSWVARHGEEDAISKRIRRVEAMEDAGTEVLVCEADITDEEQMEAAFALAEERFGAISGVIHAAGASKESRPIAEIDRAYCERQFMPKLRGLEVLDRLLAKWQVDFCLVNSSLASMLGVTEFAAYTASHLYLDAFVSNRSQDPDCKTRWISINWDNWATADVDLDSLPPGIARFVISPTEGAVALRGALSLQDTPQVAVSTGDLQARLDQWSRREADRGSEVKGQQGGGELYERPALETEYAAPRNESERILAEIWQDMLGIKQIGIHDNFFELGGDSVLNIQIVARAAEAGLRFTPRQAFEHQTIAELVEVAHAASARTSAAEIRHGEVPLMPIQRWFFEQPLENPNHFNQAVLLQVPGQLDTVALHGVVELLVEQHDALRARYAKEASGWVQYIDEARDAPEIRSVDLSAMEPETIPQIIETEATAAQLDLDIEQGRLLRMVYFDAGPQRPGRLLIVIHHLVIDAVSWRILLQDLYDAYRQVSSGSEASLPAPTAALKTWSEGLIEYTNSAIGDDAVDYWRSRSAQAVIPLPRDFDRGLNDACSSRTLTVTLPETETRLLVTTVSRVFKARVNEILQAALWRCLSRWTNRETVALTMEGHGREPLFDDIDLSRTLGWFTSLYPVWLAFPLDIGPEDLIKAVKEQMYTVPHNGMSYGMLRYLSEDPEVRATMRSLPLPEISFLYLGQLEHSAGEEDHWQPAPESPGPIQDPAYERPHLIDISAMIAANQLSVSWIYSANCHRAETIQTLADNLLQELRVLIEHSQEIAQSSHLPSDFSARGLSKDDLNKIASRLKSKKARFSKLG